MSCVDRGNPITGEADRCLRSERFANKPFFSWRSLPGFAAAVGYSGGAQPEELPFAVFRQDGDNETPIAFCYTEQQAKAIANMINREGAVLDMMSKIGAAS